MVRRSQRGALASILAGALAACTGGSSDVLAVSETDGPSVVLELSSCNATYAVEVDETEEQVSIRLEQITEGTPGAECLDAEEVPIDDPLGDRAVVINGEEFDVARTGQQSD